jgi:CRISPR system Cascade subunit CasD
MTDFVVFQLYGPMAAWGDIAVGEYRPSFAHPSKSAIIGLVAAALGIRRDEEERQRSLAKACSLAVRIDAMGVLLRDYHTVQVPPSKKGTRHYTRRSELAHDDLNTILSTRDYRCDAAYIIALQVGVDSEFKAEKICKKLSDPEFTLYLGRKSCPLALPLQPKVIKAENVKKVLEEVQLSDDLQNVPHSPFVGIYWEDGVESGYESDHVVTRRDDPISRTRWQFTERREHYTSIAKEIAP